MTSLKDIFSRILCTKNSQFVQLNSALVSSNSTFESRRQPYKGNGRDTKGRAQVKLFIIIAINQVTLGNCKAKIEGLNMWVENVENAIVLKMNQLPQNLVVFGAKRLKMT